MKRLLIAKGKDQTKDMADKIKRYLKVANEQVERKKDEEYIGNYSVKRMRKREYSKF